MGGYGENDEEKKGNKENGEWNSKGDGRISFGDMEGKILILRSQVGRIRK